MRIWLWIWWGRGAEEPPAASVRHFETERKMRMARAGAGAGGSLKWMCGALAIGATLSKCGAHGNSAAHPVQKNGVRDNTKC
jgi:hypothetical protein